MAKINISVYTAESATPDTEYRREVVNTASPYDDMFLFILEELESWRPDDDPADGGNDSSEWDHLVHAIESARSTWNVRDVQATRMGYIMPDGGIIEAALME